MIVETSAVLAGAAGVEKAIEGAVEIGIKEAANVAVESALETDKVLISKSLDFKNPPECMKNHKFFEELGVYRADPETGPAQFNKFISESSNAKGELGETIAYGNVKDIFGGEITNQVTSGANRIDLIVNGTEKNAGLKVLEVRESGIEASKAYIPKGKKIAMEVKNGSKDYIKSEISSGHVLDQIREGAKAADVSFLGVRQDVYNEILKDQSMIDYVNKVSEAGGRIVPILPSLEIQIVKALEV